MKLVIIRPDNSVILDGAGLWVDCAALPAYIHAVQWDGEEGWIEFVNDHKGQHLPNLKISNLSPYAFLVEKWNETKAENDARAKAIADANAAAKADGPAALAHVRSVAGPAAPEA